MRLVFGVCVDAFPSGGGTPDVIRRPARYAGTGGLPTAPTTHLAPPDPITAALHSPDRPVAPKVLARWRQLCWCRGETMAHAALHMLIRLDADRSILKRCLPLCVIHVFPFAFSLSVCSCLDYGVCLCGVSHHWSPPTLDYAEQLRLMQKTKDKLELALEKHQDCTYLLSPPVSLSSVS